MPAAMTTALRREAVGLRDEHEVAVLFLEPDDALAQVRRRVLNCAACSASARTRSFASTFGKPATSKMYFSG